MGKRYARIENGRVREIIKCEGIFENIPIEKRYNKEFLMDCKECGEEVKQGMDYNYETGEFSEHIYEEEPSEIIENEEENVEDNVEEEKVNVEEEKENGEPTN